MAKFKVGDLVKRVGSRHNGMCVGDVDVVVEVYAGGSAVSLDRFGAGHSDSNLLLVQTSWDYSEARRLQDAARAAVEAYNEYIKRKPTDVFPEVFNPFQS